MAALEIKQIKGNTWYIPSPANIGVYADNGNAVIIDSGNDKEAGRQICRLIDSLGWKLSMIINTHSNADHAGGNAFIQNKTGCRIAATRVEAAFIENPLLEPAFLFGGFPHTGLRNKFLMANESRVTDIIEPGDKITSPGGAELWTIPLPGHFFGMIGVKTPDNVIFLADTLFSEHIVNKYSIFYLFDVGEHLKTLQAIETLEADYFLPSHAELTDNIKELAAVNRAKIYEISGNIADLCREEIELDGILSGLCAIYNIELNDNQYVLVQSSLKAYLVYLLQKGELSKEYRGGRLFWKKA
ncbi:MAG: MBL fold metallo-hydrolase [Spirochaetales bacterium]|nr:MBL fold metallo-hydrolase [Spirochaetales bacterium]